MSVNARHVSAGRALGILRAGWQAQSAGALTTSWMLHGRPGVGKTQIVAQLANEIGAQLFDLRLTTIEPQDLRGLPYYDHDAKKTIWYRPEDLPDDPTRPAILFLDELTAASPYLQPTVYGLLQERRVARHRLPDSVMVIAAGNDASDGAIAHDMGTALSDRLVHLVVRAEPDDWLRGFAIDAALHPAVTAFIRARPDLLDTTEDALRRGQTIACTPRSWERVSRITTAIPDRDIRNAMVAGTVGDAAAAEYASVADDIAATLRLEDLLDADADARADLYPDTLNGLNALVFALVGSASETRLASVIDVMAGLRGLPGARPRDGFEKLPLGELAAFGFEMLIARALDAGLQDAFAQSQSYAAYAADRRAAGLD